MMHLPIFFSVKSKVFPEKGKNVIYKKIVTEAGVNIWDSFNQIE